MEYAHLIIAVPGILFTSCFAVLFCVRIEKLSDSANLLIERGLSALIGVTQMNFWAILLFGVDTVAERTFFAGRWPVIITILFWFGVLRPIKLKLYPRKELQKEA